ncbi:MAG: hypothetical protein L0177_02790 [Chloroflexi bacterium]|nr:hypothetical protein [Chloroflexota bacterium]
MEKLLLIVLLVAYILIGIATKEYSWRTRAVLVVMTFGVPAGFYFLF